jgi:hypothetical protein
LLREWLSERFYEHGALVFRGFDVTEAQHFEDIAKEVSIILV